MPAGGANEPPRGIRLQPPLVLASVPHAVLGSEHPPMPLAVEHREITYREPKCARLQPAVAPLLDQRAKTNFSLGKGVDCHGLTVSCCAEG